jgi:hypothetical protein
MADQYTMNWTDGTSFTVQPRTIDYTSSSLTIFGKGSQNYGEGIQENLLHILENFASTTPPVNAVDGQLWYDATSQLLQIYKNGGWSLAGADPAFIDAVNAHMADTVIHMTADESATLASLTSSVTNPSDLAYLSGLTSNVQTQLDDKVSKTGDTMTGPLTVDGNIIINQTSATVPFLEINGLLGQAMPGIRNYDPDTVSNPYSYWVARDNRSFVIESGSTSSTYGTTTLFTVSSDGSYIDTHGAVINNVADPLVGTDAANKQYVDTSIYNGFKSLSSSAPGTALYQYRFEVYATAGQTVFTLPWTYIPGSNDLSVYINGVRQAGNAYTETSVSSITFASGLNAGDEVMFNNYIFGGGLNGASLNGIASVTRTRLTAPGGTTVFTVPSYVIGTNNLQVWVQGVKQISGTAYTETSSTSITFSSSLPAGTIIDIDVLNLMNASANSTQTWPTYSEIYREVITANTAGQTLFTLTTPYHHTTTVGDPNNAGIDVFIQGIMQGSDELSETNGTSFVLASGVPIGTVIEFYAYELS